MTAAAGATAAAASASEDNDTNGSMAHRSPAMRKFEFKTNIKR